jgi:steroid 5-alpha reductase family enzyme
MWSRGDKRELQRKMSYAYLASARTLLGELAALSWSSIPAAFTSSDPIAISTLLFVGVIAYCFFGGVLTQTYSYVDQLWSLLPLAYAWIFLMYGNPNPRVWLMAAIATAWGVRLTYNFARKGDRSGFVLVC